MLPEERKAIAKFASPQHAASFQHSFHRYTFKFILNWIVLFVYTQCMQINRTVDILWIIWFWDFFLFLFL